MKINEVVKSTQEQAVASWINYLNQLRLDQLANTLSQEQANFDEAMKTISATLETISRDIVYNGKGRGGQCGMHGFIAEVAECGIGNARSLIEGKFPVYEWINDNGPEDLRRGAQLIQQKFVQSGNHLSLQAIQMHFSKYPDFLAEGGRYQIPADHFEKIKWLLSIPEGKANQLSTADGSFSFKQWKEVHDFFRHGTVPLDSIEPSHLNYHQVQRDCYSKTLNQETDSLKSRNQERRKIAFENSRPNLKEGMQAAAGAAAVEGITTFCLDVISKRKEGKQLKEFTSSDWSDICKNSGFGCIKGGVRGGGIYFLTNYTATPAAVANAVMTASFGIAEQAHQLRNGELDEVSFLLNSEDICLSAAVSALSSFAGQALIPIPILGAVIGNSVGTIIYQIAKDSLNNREAQLLKHYAESIRILDESLQREYQASFDIFTDNIRQFTTLLDQAFAPDLRMAFESSVQLAKKIGVPIEEILDCRDKINSYFMDET